MHNADRDLLEALDSEEFLFRKRFMLSVSSGIVVILVLLLGAYTQLGLDTTLMVIFGGSFLSASIAMTLAYADRVAASGLVFFVGGLFVLGGGALLADPLKIDVNTGSIGDTALYVGLIYAVFAGYISGRWSMALVSVVNVVMVTAVVWTRLDIVTSPELMIAGAAPLIMLQILVSAAMWFFFRRTEDSKAAMRQRLVEIELVMRSARRISAGDLTEELAGDTDVSEVVRDMVSGLRSLVLQIRDAAVRVNAATTELTAMASQQSVGATRQSAAIEETQGVLNGLVDGARQIADSADVVLLSSEQTLATNRDVAERIEGFSQHAVEIGSLLENIRDIGIKSETLALNASLEGIRAGDAGRGFILVATEMQALAESVTDSVKDVQTFTNNIRRFTEDTVGSVQEAAHLAAGATDSAREIHLVIHSQKASNEQLYESMGEIAHVTREVNASSVQLMSASQLLSDMADEMDRLVARFAI